MAPQPFLPIRKRKRHADERASCVRKPFILNKMLFELTALSFVPVCRAESARRDYCKYLAV